MIKEVIDLIKAIKKDLKKWPPQTKPWFRGESGKLSLALRPKIASYKTNEENHLLQSFRRQAGGIANVPDRKHTDMWLFLAQHYGVPTRLLDWTEGALMALYFAINKGKAHPRVYMLNPRKLNEFAGVETKKLNFPLSWAYTYASLYVDLAWQNRSIPSIKRKMNREKKHENHTTSKNIDRVLKILEKNKLDIPVAFPAVYQDTRMIAQRSCFTIHGKKLKPLKKTINESKKKTFECLIEYKIDPKKRKDILKDLSILGISAATIFPDLDNLAIDLRSHIKGL